MHRYWYKRLPNLELYCVAFGSQISTYIWRPQMWWESRRVFEQAEGSISWGHGWMVQVNQQISQYSTFASLDSWTDNPRFQPEHCKKVVLTFTRTSKEYTNMPILYPMSAWFSHSHSSPSEYLQVPKTSEVGGSDNAHCSSDKYTKSRNCCGQLQQNNLRS